LDNSFPKKARIRKSKDFRFIKDNGKVFKTRKLIFNFRNSIDSNSKLGIIVTKKVGNSVFRNTVRRWTREIFRTRKELFVNPVDVIIIPRTSDLFHDEILADYLFFAKWLNEKNPPSSN